MQRPPLTPAEFEEGIRRSLTVEKLRASLTDWLSVPDKELEQEYRRRNDKVKLAVVSFTADKFRAQVTRRRDAGSRRALRGAHGRLQDPREAEDPVPARRHRRAAREGHRAAGRHRARLQRQHRAVLDARAGPRQPHPAQDRRQGRSGGEGEGRGRPEAGEEPAPTSATLAKKYSEDEANAKNGGDLDYFGARPHGAGVRRRRRSRCSPARSAISSRRSSAITSSR